MRALWLILLLLAVPSAFAVPVSPDLDVTHISLTPRPFSYYPNYNAGYGRPTDPNTNQVISLEAAQAIKHYHAPGDPVTFTAHVVNHGGTPSGPFTWEWLIDDVVVKTGSHPGLAADAAAVGTGSYTVRGFYDNPNGYTYSVATLRPDTFADFDLPWAWQDGPHRVTFRLVPLLEIAEVSTRNNTRTEWSDAMAFFITVRRSAYNAFREVQNFTIAGSEAYPAGYGSYSFEDWLQYHVDLMHDKFRKSVYPTAPEGIKEHIRMDTILILDDSEPQESVGPWGIYRAVNGWDSTWPFGQYPASQSKVMDWGLLHEWGHQLGLIDLYQMDIMPSENLAPDLDGYPTGIGRWAHQGGMMHGHGDTNFSEFCAVAMNSQTGRRRGWYGDFQYLIPTRNRVRVVDNAGNPVTGASVTAWQAKPVGATPVFEGVTDAEGYMDLPNRKAVSHTTEYRPGAPILYTEHDNPFGQVDVVAGRNVLFFRVQSGERREHFWLDSTDFTRAWFATGPDDAVHTFQTHFAPAGAPEPPANLTARAGASGTVRLDWTGSPTFGVGSYRIYRAVEPEYRWQFIRSTRASLRYYVDSVSPRQMVRYAVTAATSTAESAFSNEAGLYTFEDMRGVAALPGGGALAADYPREQPIWLRTNLSPIAPFGSVHNHTSAMDAGVLSNGDVVYTGGPGSYTPEPGTYLFILSPDGSQRRWLGVGEYLFRPEGSGAGQWRIPEGVSVGRDNDIIVTDTGNHRVEVLYAYSGSTRRVFGAGDLVSPVDTIQLPDGSYITTDRGANRLALFSEGGTLTGTISLTGPAYIDRWTDGTMAVSQPSMDRVALLNADGSLRKYITEAPAGALNRPTGVAFGPSGDLLVADADNRRLVRIPSAVITGIGDVNGDGTFNSDDVTLALKIAAGMETATADQIIRGDVVKGPNILPDIIDLKDATELARRLGAG